MKLLKPLLIVFCLFFLMKSSVYSQVFSFESDSKEHTAIFPRGTMIKAEIQQAVSSKHNKVGDAVSFVVNSDLTVGKATCIPEGSYMYGKIIQLERAKPGRDGYFLILVDKLVFPDGWHTPMVGKIWTMDGTGIIGGGVTSRQEFKKIPHHIENIGPIVQLVKTGPRAMGQEKMLLADKKLIIVLDQDLQVKYLENLD